MARCALSLTKSSVGPLHNKANQDTEQNELIFWECQLFSKLFSKEFSNFTNRNGQSLEYVYIDIQNVKPA